MMSFDNRLLYIVFIFVILGHSYAAQAKESESLSYQDVANGIQQTFESRLFELPPRIQGHYGIRLYRMTGDEKYLPSALYDYYVVADRMHAIVDGIDNKSFIKERSEYLTGAMSKGKRGKARRKALKAFPEFIFYADELLRHAARLNAFGVELPGKIKRTIAQYDYLPAITDKTMIQAWAAQIANYVYWLHQLGIADHRVAYKEAFLAAYPDKEDDKLSRWHFRNKVYGLTHFIFAASGFYQHNVSSNEFGWILDYFDQNKRRILNDATDDIVAEVGISFLLMDKKSHPLVELTKQRLVRAYNVEAGMIPSVSGKLILSSGEHRNVLTYMLMTWPEQLTPGPFFNELESMNKYVPVQLLDNKQKINKAKNIENKETYQQSANKIRAEYDSNFLKLKTSAQNHYAARMYRLTGDTHYASQAVNEVYQISERLDDYANSLDSATWRVEQARAMIDRLPTTKRGKRRKNALANTGDKRFALYLVYQLAKLNEYGLEHPAHQQFIRYLKQADLHDLLMSPQFIKAYAAQVANYVYWLKTMDVVDWTGELKMAFESAYPDAYDQKLTKSEFNNKVYGLTHIILADSNYYQNLVSATEHQWILDYFERHEDRIVNKTKADIQAEVGLSFLLTEQGQHKTLKAMKVSIQNAIHPTKDRVLSSKGNDDLSKGEHRNVLAYALLNWPDKLFKGPILNEHPELKRRLPSHYQ
ncbi:DUF3541 domain-containing protein [Thalassotalea atypica]|uniref:DUF3541 domain-containing protein n=1 Tax=Thalassotalea atypica TaxID=2054316 RepID=UPI002573F945|nr:DUF3541 domain-containing protein [Thalassotalea atypica]